MKIKIILSCLLVICISASYAQVDPLYAQYLNNPLLINPAYSGLNNNLNGSLTYRKQWAGFDGSPSTLNANAHTSLFDNKMGVGLIVLQDNAGNNSNTEVHGTYAYRIDLDEKILSFGIQAGITAFKSNNGELNPFDQNDPLFTGDQNYTKPSFGSGIILSSERYFFGLSVPRMLKPKVTFGNEETSLYKQHFYLTGAYVVFLSERIRMKPSVLFKGVKGAPISTDLNFAFNVDERYTAGVFTRNFNTYGLLGLIKFKDKYRFGYVFEVPTNKSVGARYTSHELTLGFNLSVLSFHSSSITNF